MAEHAVAEAKNLGSETGASEHVDGAVKRHGLWWPAGDQIAFEDIALGLPFLRSAVGVCAKRRTVIQAGGNAGMYPVELAKHFERVITFEPDPLNYRCLTANAAGRPNIECHNAAVGAKAGGRVSVTRWAPNSGCGRVIPGRDAPMVRIDDLGVEDCDFIQLDIEGFELPALMGAMQTLMRCRPVVMVERRGHGEDPTGFLGTLGYGVLADSETDRIYKVA